MRASCICCVLMIASAVGLSTGAGSAAAAGETCGGLPATIVGTPGDDLLEGTPGADVIVAGAGSDTVTGRGGNDLICADSGDGGPAQPDADEIDAGSGDDVVFPSDGSDTIDGGDGQDYLDGGEGDDHVAGGDNDDYLVGGAGIDFLSDVSGDDYLEGGGGDDVLQIETGANYLDGGLGDDILRGGTGPDYLDGGPGADFALGLGGGDGQDFYDGGAGPDQLAGSNDAEYLQGGPGADRLMAAGGDDYLDGGDGGDELEGGLGQDYFDGGSDGDALLADDGEADTEFDCGPGLDTLDADQVEDSAVHRLECEDDADGDGLIDDWEEFGYDADGDGHPEIDLPGLGADALRKDVFVRVVWLDDSDSESDAHSHKLSDAARDKVVDAFKDAPVANPGGSARGIRLHVIRAGSIPETDDNRVLDHCVGGDSWDWSWLDEIKRSGDEGESFLTATEARVFHFAFIGHGGRDCDGEAFGGVSRNSIGGSVLSDAVFAKGASDFVVTQGAARESVVATTFMHELGHNLGLGHGGVDLNAGGEVIGANHLNGKPNHLSVMNYLFSLHGLRIAPFGDTDRRLDYSHFDRGDLPDLNEHEVSEPAGLSGSAAVAGYGSLRYCPDGTVVPINDLAARVDWNCNEDEGQDDVVFDINFTGDVDDAGNPIIQQFPLATANEWDALVFDGGAVGQAGPPVELPTTTDIVVAPEPTLEELNSTRIGTTLTARAKRHRWRVTELGGALQEVGTGKPIAGREVGFRLRHGRTLCTGTTDDAGVARCSTRARLRWWPARRIVAVFAGDDVYRDARTVVRRTAWHWPWARRGGHGR
jgi:Ca2+-binding RTX toxin-like protein